MVSVLAKPNEGYYNLPMLKRPLWGWEIALYFFFEGISSGAYILAVMAETSNDGRYNGVIRRARYLSLAALLPCPPLLIADLGRPERFHHMLRVFKPQSPMNMGAWALSGFSVPVGLLALAQLLGVHRFPARVLGLAGLPFAFFMLGYPGVLLATTSVPLWSRSRLLGAVLGASSMSAAAGALSIAAAFDPRTSDRTFERLHQIEQAARTVESAAVTTYLVTTGSAAKPLTEGRYSRLLRGGAFMAGIAIPALLTVTRRKPSRTAAIASGLLAVAGSLALKWSIVHAGRESVEDPRYAREATARV